MFCVKSVQPQAHHPAQPATNTHRVRKYIRLKAVAISTLALVNMMQCCQPVNPSDMQIKLEIRPKWMLTIDRFPLCTKFK